MKTPRFLVAACVSLALAFTFSCSSDSSDDPPPTPIQSSSSGGGSSSVVSSSSSSAYLPISYGTLPYEGQNYKTVKIGTQVWMAENLNYDVPYNATDVCYGNNSSNCTTYGRLYNWATAMGLNSNCNTRTCSDQVQSTHRGICPSGWHIPSDDDWSQLFDYVGGSSVAGKHLKAKTGWFNCGPSGSGSSYSCEDTHGFSALPGGGGNLDGSFSNVGNYGAWWSAYEYSRDFAFFGDMHNYREGANRSGSYKTYLLSVRCVQD